MQKALRALYKSNLEGINDRSKVQQRLSIIKLAVSQTNVKISQKPIGFSGKILRIESSHNSQR
uniref:Uncharacterized protein n=1 Tax=Desertifilum tharense IPPAS B-1220 TaxID=1781255 RepID=A0A1E5QEL1_9CYAN|nr:hypothetical protein BH720_21285 [Desertifilum tharense IPPAS B-1220]